MKTIIGIVVLGSLAFMLTLIGALFFTGNLNKEGIDTILGTGKTPPETVAEQDLDPLLAMLAKREDEVKTRAQELNQQEERLKLRERDLEESLKSLAQTLTQVTEQLDSADQDYEVRLQEVATSLGGMKPQNAAEVLKEWPPTDAARVLSYVDERKRGKILDEVTPPDRAALILRALQERGY